ncbi:MAG: hypothetical protein WC880_03940 [Candidatus Paceibacterota bacterium]
MNNIEGSGALALLGVLRRSASKPDSIPPYCAGCERRHVGSCRKLWG